MVSAICLVNGSLPPQDVSASSTVNIALQDSAGVSSWSLQCTSTDELNTASAVNATIVIDNVHFTATFTMPSTTSGSAVQLTSIVNGDQSTKVKFGVFVLGPMSNRLLFPGETNESSSQYGVVADLNIVGRTTPGSAPVATNVTPGTIILDHDLGGTYALPDVVKIHGTSVPASPSANDILTATSSTTAAWQQSIDITGNIISAATVTGNALVATTSATAADFQAPGTVSHTGLVRAANNTVILAARDNTDGYDLTLLQTNASNALNIGNTNHSDLFLRGNTQSSINVGGQVTFSITDNGSGLMLPNLVGLSLGIRPISSSSYTIDSSGSCDTLIFVDCTSNTVSLTLPAPTQGRVIIVIDQKGQSGTHTIQVNQHASEKISGSTAKQLTVAYQIMVLMSDGTNWNEFTVGP